VIADSIFVKKIDLHSSQKGYGIPYNALTTLFARGLPGFAGCFELRRERSKNLDSIVRLSLGVSPDAATDGESAIVRRRPRRLRPNEKVACGVLQMHR
jgi:hypothetical protein